MEHRKCKFNVIGKEFSLLAQPEGSKASRARVSLASILPLLIQDIKFNQNVITFSFGHTLCTENCEDLLLIFREKSTKKPLEKVEKKYLQDEACNNLFVSTTYFVLPDLFCINF